MALSWLETLPSRIKDRLPAPDNFIADRGWRTVLPRQLSNDTADTMATDPMDVDPQGCEVRGPRRLIFHAPGVEGEAQSAKRLNKLYEWAKTMRKIDKSCATAEFTFEPTMEWYKEQVEKGQGLNHVEFSPRRAVLARHKIPDPKDVSDQG